MTAQIQVLDYGSGNLFSIKDALSRISPNIKVRVSSHYRKESADGLVLPGVGSFSSAQKILGENREAILEDVQENGMPLLGICLGMQLMFERSQEGKGTGLELFKGKVVKFNPEHNLKIPQMGWNTLDISAESNLCRGLPKRNWVYFVHSFYPSPEDEGIIRAWTTYGSQRFPSVIEEKNVFGTQFHPEKSSNAGFRMITNYAKSVLSYSK